MSNTDYSQTTYATQKGAQTQFAGYVSKTADAAVTNNLVRMGGGADAGVGLATTLGAAVAGATKVGQPLSANKVSTSYSVSRYILAAAGRA
jgi:hypothetical protein